MIYIHAQKLPFVGGAVQEGINLAKGSHLVMMSADLETDQLIPKKLSLLHDGNKAEASKAAARLNYYAITYLRRL